MEASASSFYEGSKAALPDDGTVDSNALCFVSRIRTATIRPEAKVRLAINQMAACTPTASATIPANSAPMA
jgi:hypothetical protein